MRNKVKQCKDCLYNTSKKAGGRGRICNGLTQVKHNRCPEWRISELIREGKAGNLIERV